MIYAKKNIDPSQWLQLYGDYLFSLAIIKVSNKETAEDLVQETFMMAIKAKDSFRFESSEKTWLTTILKNKITDYYRRKDVLKNAEEYIAATETSFAGHFFDRTNGHWLDNAAPGSWTDSADTSVNRNEFYQVVQHCIQKMPSRLVPVFMAKFMDDEDAGVICKEQNISPSNYWVIIHRAKVLMRSCLEKNWF